MLVKKSMFGKNSLLVNLALCHARGAGEGKVEGRLSTAKATFTLLPLTKVGSPLLFKFLQGKSISADSVNFSKLRWTFFIGIPKPSPKLVGCQGGSIPPKLI